MNHPILNGVRLQGPAASAGPLHARILIVDECPDIPTAQRTRDPLYNSATRELQKMLAEAGININDCYYTYLCRYAPPGGYMSRLFLKDTDKNRIPHDVLKAEIKRLEDEIEEINPTVIVPLGDYALWAVTGNRGIDKWRGSQLEVSGRKVIPSLSPRLILRRWDWRFQCVRDFQRVAKEQGSREYTKPRTQYLIRPDYPTAIRTLKTLLARANLSRAPVRLAGDLETRNGHIACFGIAWSSTDAICIPFMCVEREAGYWSAQEEINLVRLCVQLAKHRNVEWVYQNGLYDNQYFARWWGVIFPIWMDTMVTHHVLWAGTRKGLDFLSSMYLDFHRYWKDDGKTWDPKKHDEDQYWRYNCDDAAHTWEIAGHLEKHVKSWGMEGPNDFQTKRQLPAVLRMMLRGVRINVQKKAELGLKLLEVYGNYEQWVHKIVGRPLNIKSPKQMSDFFYGELQLPIQRAKGRPTLNENALKKLSQKEPLIRPLLSRIIEMRSIGVFNGTFVQMRLDHDRRARCSYAVAGTETFRYTSSEDAFGFGGNLQNIPKGDDEEAEAKKAENERKGFLLPNIRELFIPDPEMGILDVDLDRADLAVVVWEADDNDLKQKFLEGVDLHVANASDIFGVPFDRVSKSQRQFAKAFVHGTNYGGSAATMARAANCTVHEASQAQKRWFAAHPGIASWHEHVERSLQETRQVANKFGFRRYYFDRIDGLLPEALAWIPQSTVAIVIDKALCNISENLPKVHPIMQVHDSLVMQLPKSELKVLLPEIRRNMLIEIPYDDPLTIPIGAEWSPTDWGSVKKVSWEEGAYI